MEMDEKRHSLVALPQPTHPLPILQEAGWASGTVRSDTNYLASTGVLTTGSPACSELLDRLHKCVLVKI